VTMTDPNENVTIPRPVESLYSVLRLDGETSQFVSTGGYNPSNHTTLRMEDATRLATQMQERYPQYTYQVVNLADAVASPTPAWTDGLVEHEAQALRDQIDTLNLTIETLRNDVVAARAANRATVARVQSTLQEMADEEPSWDRNAYNDFADRVNGYISWPFDRYEQEYTVMGTVNITVTIPVSVSTTVTAPSGEAAQEMVDNEPGEWISEGDVRDGLDGLSAYDIRNHWDGDWEDWECTDVDEQ
jgi:hypothetical protein